MRNKLIICFLCIATLLTFGGCYGVSIPGSFDAQAFYSYISQNTSEASADSENVPVDLLKALTEANKFDRIIEKYGRLSYSVTNIMKDGTPNDWSIYADDKRYVSVSEWGTEIVEDNEVYGYENSDGSLKPYRIVFIDSFDSFVEDNVYTSMYTESDPEQILSEEEKNGLIYLTTAIPGDLCESFYSFLGYSKDDVDEMITEYVIDKTSLIILSLQEYISKDGEKSVFYECSLDTDCDEYIPDQELIDAIFSEDDIRTDTVIVDAGTSKERTVTQTAKKGCGFVSYTGDEFYDTMYTDPGCFTKLGKIDKSSDITVYVKRKPDYSVEANWAYFGEGEDRPADLFLVCPTVDTKDEFVMSMDDAKTKEKFLGALNMERGIYEADTRMYAPYYRQAAMKVYSLSPQEREPYLEYAYDDISESFRYYLENENNGRPIVLAGFSQGADMCYRLLQEYFGDEELYDRLVAVYAIGWPCSQELVEEYPQIKPAASEIDTGVVVSFECEAPEVKDTFIMPAGTSNFTINPLNWKTDGTPADKSENLGACFTDYSGNIVNEVKEFCGCYIDEDRAIIKVADVNAADYPAIVPGLPEGSYHIYDYQFFFRNLEKNVHDRLESWLASDQ